MLILNVCFLPICYTVELQWLEQLWNHGNMFETGKVQADECYYSTRSGGLKRLIFSIFFNLKVCCVFSLESPHRGDSNEDKKIYHFHNKKKKITLDYPKSVAMGFFS